MHWSLLPIRIVSALLLAGTLLPAALARDESSPVRIPVLVPFASPEGLDRLARAAGRSDFAPLSNQFEAQVTIAFCGPTSAAIVLNALDPQGMGAPRDRSRLIPADGLYLPKDLELTVRRHTQESVIATGKKTRAQVFGEPSMINGKVLRDGGYQLRQLDDLLQAHKIRTRLVIADEQKAEAEIRKDLIDNLNRAGDFVIVNYHRGAVGQTGGGHISPLGAYDAASDSVLILDVNPSHHPWVWMPLATLIQGMRTRDAVENRGYILVQSQ
ncbi:phytochelatin synthase family protein [Dechloromonas sp. A34]|uniref:phytochelatin synthase family protein n=1 Tax=Dechloromonas sp. A34 TaxID=447588 RepID=UPI0022491F42|nr:phytochelatin synthase family protein [Dechloromonas sp. A34]